MDSLDFNAYLRAGSLQLDDAELLVLLVNGAAQVRSRIAERKGLDIETLFGCSKDRSALVRAAVAANPATPLEILRVLADDPNLDLKYSMAENHNLPLEILEKLSSDDNPYIHNRATRTMERLERQRSH
ncbi:MAG: hypothetical protein K2X27_28640 [Candidatus Obscuribacterales bacterium]|nr:hypothetical protein [Candidatus Obscuribacterales bacterium]